MYFNQEIECLPLPKLRKLQDERLRKLVNYQYAHIPFYRNQWDRAGVKPGDIKGVADLPLLPFTRKNDLRDQYPFGMFAVPKEEVIRIHASSGTTGKPTVVGYTREDLAIFNEVVARSLVAGGAQPGMKLHNAYGYGLFTGGLGMHGGGELLGMSVVPISGGMTDRQILLLQDFAPEVICCTPSYALTLAGEIQKRGIDPADLAVQFAILGAEPWSEKIRAEVEAGLGVTATNIYGLSEIIGPGVSQEDWEEKNGSYIWEDHFFPEIVDPETGVPLKEGETGVLVFTTLSKTAMPLMRYWTNDLTYLYYDPNGKRSHIKMGPILGRADDMLIIRGVNLFPSQVEEVLARLIEFSPHYQLQITRNGTMDEVCVRVELAAELCRERSISELTKYNDQAYLEELAEKLRRKIKDTIGLSMAIQLEDQGVVPRSLGGKLNRVLDER